MHSVVTFQSKYSNRTMETNNMSISFKKRGIFLDSLIIIRLESQPHLARVTTLLMRHFCRRLIDQNLLPFGTAGCISHHLCMTASIQRNEQECSFIHSLTTSDHTMILQDDIAANRAKGFCNSCSFFGGYNSSAIPVIHRKVLIES